MSVAPENDAGAGAAAEALPAPASAVRTSAATDLALISTFAAFIAVCAILPGIPTPSGVPITLQTFAVILSGLVLGARRGTLAVLLYVAVGFAGVPVFSGGKPGLAMAAGPTVGYVIAFPIAAALAGVLGSWALRLRTAGRRAPGGHDDAQDAGTPVRRVGPTVLPVLALAGAGLAASLLSIHPLGVTGLVVRGGMPWAQAIAADAVFLPGDVLKNLVAAVVATSVLAAFPELRRSRR